MEVIDARSALLSNFEVLSLLRELENEHLTRTKTALRVKKEEEDTGSSAKRIEPVTSENLRTIQVEAIQYLTAEYQPLSRQNETSIRRLTRDLRPYELTKAEKLQVVNLAPTTPVELYVIVEELEDRLGDSMNDVLNTVESSLSALQTNLVNTTASESRQTAIPSTFATDQYDMDADGDADMDPAHNDTMFDDTGEGNGIEGDLEMDDD